MPSSIVDSVAGSVNDIFAGIGSLQGGKIKAQGIRIKAQGDLAEASEYDLAGGLALKNKAFTEQSQQIKQMQLDRQIETSQGETEAGVAGAGFAKSGSALDLLRDSASQGALTKAVLGQQGLITEAGFQEQSDSYNLMSSAARSAAAQEFDIANQTEDMAKTAATGSFISAGIKGATAIAGLAML